MHWGSHAPGQKILKTSGDETHLLHEPGSGIIWSTQGAPAIEVTMRLTAQLQVKHWPIGNWARNKSQKISALPPNSCCAFSQHNLYQTASCWMHQHTPTAGGDQGHESNSDHPFCGYQEAGVLSITKLIFKGNSTCTTEKIFLF